MHICFGVFAVTNNDTVLGDFIFMILRCCQYENSKLLQRAQGLSIFQKVLLQINMPALTSKTCLTITSDPPNNSIVAGPPNGFRGLSSTLDPGDKFFFLKPDEKFVLFGKFMIHLKLIISWSYDKKTTLVFKKW